MSEFQRGEITTEIKPLTERLDGPIEDVSVGVSALLTKIVRQSIKSGIQKLDEGLEESVRHKIDADIERRGPDLEDAARKAAQSEVGEQVGRLRDNAKRSGERLLARIESIEELWRSERETRQNVQAETDEHLGRISENLESYRETSDEHTQSLRKHAEKALSKLQTDLESKTSELHRTIEQQQAVIRKQQEVIAALDAKIKDLLKLESRTKQVEEKVFAPGFFGRLFGKKPKVPEIED